MPTTVDAALCEKVGGILCQTVPPVWVAVSVTVLLLIFGLWVRAGE